MSGHALAEMKPRRRSMVGKYEGCGTMRPMPSSPTTRFRNLLVNGSRVLVAGSSRLRCGRRVTNNYVSHGLPGGAGWGEDAGGAIFAADGSLTVLDSTISGNQSTVAGAGIVVD